MTKKIIQTEYDAIFFQLFKSFNNAVLKWEQSDLTCVELFEIMNSINRNHDTELLTCDQVINLMQLKIHHDKAENRLKASFNCIHQLTSTLIYVHFSKPWPDFILHVRNKLIFQKNFNIIKRLRQSQIWNICLEDTVSWFSD